MQLKEWLKKFNFEKLKIKTPYLEAEFSWSNKDKEAAWELYVELLTRITTQPLADDSGIEKTALDSIYSLFPTTREILKEKGRKCVNFTKIAVVILNQIIRPFTAEWHKKSIEGYFEKKEHCTQFRSDLISVQHDLIMWTRMLADIADVEDLTDFDLSFEDIGKM